MVIQTFEKGYTVVRYCESNAQWDVFVCKDNVGEKNYTIIRIKDKKIVNHAIDFIYQQVNNKDFSDMVDCFVYEEQLHLVFHQYEGDALESKFKKEYCSLEERMQIGKKLFEKMILLNMPNFFQYFCLQKANILVTTTLEVNFNYTITGMERYQDYTQETVQSAILEFLRFLFQKELKNNVIEPMNQLLEQIQKEEKRDYLTLYQAYCGTCDEIRKIPEQELQIPKTWIFRMWEKIKSWQKVMKRAIMLIAFLGVFCYMVYHIYMAFQPLKVEKGFDYIGTVTMDDKDNGR